jgi:hypothetical protein
MQVSWVYDFPGDELQAEESLQHIALAPWTL